MALLFEDAAKAKDAIMVSQQKEIQNLYNKWADDISEKAWFYSHKTNASAPLSERYYNELYKQVKATSKMVSDEVEGIIKGNIYTVADSVVKSNIEWLKSFGFSEEGLNAAFSYIPNDVVQRLITGQIYQGGWNLSHRIWSDNQQTQKDIYQIMAKGLVEQKSVYEIAKDLESYVRPSAKLPWNLRMADGKKIYKKQIDYNAQRLARTLVQHGYQQSFIATTQKNPFITEYIWRSNGSRVCDLCKARDGVHYKKTELPMDHPNGMCTMEPVVADDMIDQLADWFNSPDGTFPEIDEFASNFGYEVSKVGTLEDFVKKYGQSSKTPGSWLNSLTQVQKAEATALKNQSGLSWGDWYEQYIYDGKGTSKYWKEKQVKSAASKVDDALAAAKSKLDAIPNKTYSNIWKEDVTLADYEFKKDKIKAKKEYFEEMMKTAKLVDKQDVYDKFAKLLDDIDEFEKNGKLYMKAQQEVKAAQMAINKAKGIKGTFTPDMYTDEAKAMAKSFTSRYDADAFHRPQLDKVWKQTSEYEHYSVWEYTQNSNPINKSLSGYHDSWDRSSFLGLGNTDLGHEDNWRRFETATFSKKFGVDGHKDYKKVIQNLTTAIDKTEMADSVFLVRGSDKGGFAGLLEGDLLSYNDALSLIKSGDSKKIKAALEGQTFTNHSFTSTGIAKGTGFGGDVKYEIFAPKGTRAIYAEPTSYYGDTVGMHEKLYKVGQSYSGVGGEAEVILQRGTDFRITEVVVDNYGDMTVKMEVVNQPDYFKTGLEHTHNGGKTSYKK